MIYEFCRDLDWMHECAEDVMRCEDMVAGIIVSLNEKLIRIPHDAFVDLLQTAYDEVSDGSEDDEMLLPKREVYCRFVKEEASHIYSFYQKNPNVTKIAPDVERLRTYMNKE